MSKKTFAGRKRIEIKPINNEDARQVAFSKRKHGLFKKASDLCVLCGAEIAIMVFSPAGKVFSFGHPCVNSVVDRYQNSDSPSVANLSLGNCLAMRRMALVRELNQQSTDLQSQIDVQKKRRAEIDQKAKGLSGPQCWWSVKADELNYHQLEEFRVMMESLKSKIAARTDDLKREEGVQTNPAGLLPKLRWKQNPVCEPIPALPILELNLAESLNQITFNRAEPEKNPGDSSVLEIDRDGAVEQAFDKGIDEGFGIDEDQVVAAPAPASYPAANPNPSSVYDNLVNGLWFFG